MKDKPEFFEQQGRLRELTITSRVLTKYNILIQQGVGQTRKT